jgi:hypothetical protein
MQTEPAKTRRGFWSPSAIILIVIWWYLAAYAVWFLISAFQEGLDGWNLFSILLIAFYVTPGVAIPIYLVYAQRRNLQHQFSKVLLWMFRVVYVSVMLAMIDCWSAASRHTTLFSTCTFAIRSGTRGYLGFGYDLTYYRSMDGPYGPVIQFWFTPIAVDMRHHHRLIHWAWSDGGD